LKRKRAAKSLKPASATNLLIVHLAMLHTPGQRGIFNATGDDVIPLRLPQLPFGTASACFAPATNLP
jgi:hypothetical protein